MNDHVSMEGNEGRGPDFRVDCADALVWLAGQAADSIDLVFGSPPYEDARLCLEAGADLRIARSTEEWVAWLVPIYQAALNCCKGLVAFVVEGRTQNYRWSASPALLIEALIGAGITVRKPPIYYRVGIPDSGGPDWLRNDYEFIVCATRGGRLPWSNNIAMGSPPRYAPGGAPSHRKQDGSRVEAVYEPPKIANPGNVIQCKAGGGNMGHPLCHENEAPFPEYLAEFFIRSFCPPGGVVSDPFVGSGTTGAMAIRYGRRFRGCDIRQSQVDLLLRRIRDTLRIVPLESTG
jgi:hypothetical protein